MNRKICVFTGTRAEYGLLQRVMQGIKDAPDLSLQVIVTGMHLSHEFGMTVQEIRADGFEPDETIEMLLAGDTPPAICKSMGLGLIGYGEALQRLKPDILMVLGDRFETFCMTAAAQVSRVPVVHIHGGETTEGAIDEAFRHSITKMSHLHFACCEAYRERIIQLGESPDRVFNVGAIGVENIARLQLMSRKALAESIGFGLGSPYFIVTFHPVTLENSTAKAQFQALLDALQDFSDYKILFTKSNADTGGRVINRMIDDFVGSNVDRTAGFGNLGVLRYLSAVKYSAAVIGNSSSGILEAPSLNIPTVNIGDRQKGRIRPPSVIDCGEEKSSIKEAIQKATNPAFVCSIENMTNPYDRPNTVAKIIEKLGRTSLKGILKKRFLDHK